MSHPIPGADYSNQGRDESKKEYRSRKSEALHKVNNVIKGPKKFKYGMNKPGNNVDKLLSALEKRKK